MADPTEPTGETSGRPETIVIRESGGGAGWVIAIVLVLAAVAAVWLLNQSNASQATRNNAVVNAAEDVGKAARDVGDAAQDAANTVNKP